MALKGLELRGGRLSRMPAAGRVCSSRCRQEADLRLGSLGEKRLASGFRVVDPGPARSGYSAVAGSGQGDGQALLQLPPGQPLAWHALAGAHWFVVPLLADAAPP